MRKRTYIKKGCWHLERGQRGDFFPIAAPLIVSLVGSVVKPILGKVIKKIIGGRRKTLRRHRRRRY